MELDNEDIQVRLQAKPGWAAAQGPGVVVVLNTELTPTLIREGFANDLVRLVQDRRKEINCQYTDRIEIGVVTDSDELKTAIRENAAYIQTETLANSLGLEALPDVDALPQDLAGTTVTRCASQVDGMDSSTFLSRARLMRWLSKAETK